MAAVTSMCMSVIAIISSLRPFSRIKVSSYPISLLSHERQTARQSYFRIFNICNDKTVLSSIGRTSCSFVMYRAPVACSHAPTPLSLSFPRHCLTRIVASASAQAKREIKFEVTIYGQIRQFCFALITFII